MIGYLAENEYYIIIIYLKNILQENHNQDNNVITLINKITK